MTEAAEGNRMDFDPRRAEMEPIYMDVVHHVEVYARRSTKPLEYALEITAAIKEELWTRWITDLSGFVAPDSNKAYAKQAVRNHKVNQKVSEELWDEVIDPAADFDALDGIEVPVEESPHDCAVNAELQQMLDTLAPELPTKTRLVWEMKTYGHTYEEIAADLGITEDTARSHYRHANNQLGESAELKAYLKEER